MRVLMGLMFFPRGGSAHVANNLARTLPGCDVRIVSGSVPRSRAEDFYAGLDVVGVEMEDSVVGDPPLHPSYEDRPGASDRVFASLGDDVYEHQVEAWCEILDDAGARSADVLHLHHLTPLHEAAARVAPDVPVVGHLHGTELLMLEEGDRWSHAAAWRERMRRWAARCERLLVLTPTQIARAVDLLGIDPRRCVVVPNGFDPEIFHPREREPSGRPVFVTVSRFTAVKRLPLLIEAFAPLADEAELMVVGGHPGEVEGEHPADAIARTGARNVTLAGWHPHEALADFYAAADAVVLASVREQFGQVLVEGMACGLPAIAVNAYGPAAIVEHGVTGWLVPPDDRAALTEAMRLAIDQPEDRRARGEHARAAVAERYAWPALAERVAEVYASVAAMASRTA
jgi:glycosyltransferase involved in cell wall biosynthesis